MQQVALALINVGDKLSSLIRQCKLQVMQASSLTSVKELKRLHASEPYSLVLGTSFTKLIINLDILH